MPYVNASRPLGVSGSNCPPAPLSPAWNNPAGFAIGSTIAVKHLPPPLLAGFICKRDLPREWDKEITHNGVKQGITNYNEASQGIAGKEG
jgi:hypothetical protein